MPKKLKIFFLLVIIILLSFACFTVVLKKFGNWIKKSAYIPNQVNNTIAGNDSKPITDHFGWLDSDLTIIDPYELKFFNQKDPRLVNYIKARYLIPPSKLPYNLEKGSAPNISEVISPLVGSIIQQVFKNKTGGFFVECGAYNGKNSHTLNLEMDFEWSGLLIECNPNLIPELKQVHRKAYIADVCLSAFDHPKMIEFTSMDNWPGASSIYNSSDMFPTDWKLSSLTTFEVQSLPFYSIIAATGATVVDLIVLDIQKMELKVLKKFPFELIFVKMWVVEYNLHSAAEQEEMKKLMSEHGYKFLPLVDDIVFVHQTVVPRNHYYH